jgi:sugar phosphate isomerase/epimerase
MSTIPVCLQLYTVRDACAEDFFGTLKKVAEIGYAGVELAGFNGKEPNDVNRVLDDNGLIVAGAHVGLGEFEKGDEVIATYQSLGAKSLAVPYLAPEQRTSLDDYKKLAATLQTIGAKVTAAGMELCYHNHDFEFEKFGGDIPAYDVLFDSTDPAIVKIEMDAFWVRKAGYDPVDYIKKYAGRVPLIHVKDMGTDGRFAEVGEGTTDFSAIFAAAESIGGTKFYVVEQDVCFNHKPLESIEISFRNLQKWGKA